MIKHVVKVGGTIGPKPGYSITSFRMPIPGNLYAQGEAYLEASIALHKDASQKDRRCNPFVFLYCSGKRVISEKLPCREWKGQKATGLDPTRFSEASVCGPAAGNGSQR
jgi:hypothetical protein